MNKPSAIDELNELGEEASRGKINYFRPEEGTTRIRILPGNYGKSKELWVVKSNQHWTMKGGNRFPILCTADVGSCCYCNALEKLKEKEKAIKEKIKSPEHKDKAERLKTELEKVSFLVKKLFPQPVYNINIHSRANGAKDVELLTAPKMLFTSLFSVFSSEGGNELIHPTEGSDFVITVKKSGRRTDYNVSISRKASPISEDPAKMQEILDKRYDLDAVATDYHTESEMQELLGECLERLEDAAIQDREGGNLKSSKGHFDDEDEIPAKREPQRESELDSLERPSASNRLSRIMDMEED